MAEARMLTEEEMTRADGWLADRGVEGSCPACGDSRKPALAKYLVVIPAADPDGPSIDRSKGALAVQLWCVNCGFIRLFKTEMMGLLKG